MKRTFVRLTACFALTAFTLAATNAHAGDHGKRRSNFSQSNGGSGNGGGNGGCGNSGGNGPSMKSMKLHSNMSRNFSSLNANGGNNGGNGNGGSQTFNPSFARKMNKSFATNQGNGSLPNATLSNKNLKFSRHGNSQFNNQFADAMKQGKGRPIDISNGNVNGGIVPAGIVGGNGNGDNKPGKFSNGKFKGWNPEKFADAINGHGNGQFPTGDNKFDDVKFGNKKFDFDKKFGNGKNLGLNFGQFCDTPNQNKNCHNGFPWWKLWTNCYPNNCFPNNCYPNNWNCHYPNNYCPPIYYNYPPVTNVTVVNQEPQILAQPAQPALPAQPTLVDGTDLELVDLRLVDLGDTAKGLGPRYRITFRNRGTLPAGNFQVMLLASTDGTPQPGLPSGIAEVAGAPSAQLLTVDVRLTPTPELATMNNLIVALDTATQVVETEESNNVAVIDRAKVLMADLAVR